MTQRIALTLLVILVFGVTIAAAPSVIAEPSQEQKNLFAPPSGTVAQPAITTPPSTFDRVAAYVQQQQRSLYRQLAGAVRAVKTEHTLAAGLSLALLSFLYGVFHAAGPGHGKAIISAYLLANEQAVKRGIVLSFAASLAQAVCAIALVSVILFALSGLGVTTKESVGVMTTIAAWLIIAIGAWMLWSSLRGVFGDRHHDHADGGCGHDHHAPSEHLTDQFNWAKAGSIVAAIGCRPCSGAIFVLLFANTIGLYMAGVWSAFAMALGTAITVSALAVLTLLSKKAAVRLVGSRRHWMEWIYRGLGILGSLAILSLGVLLLLAASAPQTPFS